MDTDTTTETELEQLRTELIRVRSDYANAQIHLANLRETTCARIWEFNEEYSLDLCEAGVEAFCNAIGIVYTPLSRDFKVQVLLDVTARSEDEAYDIAAEVARTARLLDGVTWTDSNVEGEGTW